MKLGDVEVTDVVAGRVAARDPDWLEQGRRMPERSSVEAAGHPDPGLPAFDRFSVGSENEKGEANTTRRVIRGSLDQRDVWAGGIPQRRDCACGRRTTRRMRTLSRMRSGTGH